MERWHAANPQASEAEIAAQARKITDSVDNRMGELLQDNLFWHKWIKEIGQFSMTSVGFTLGTARELAGGVKDIPASAKGLATGKGISPRTAYALALGLYVPMRNAIYQYVKTGQPPQDAQDLAHPRTGGTTPEGEPERAGLLFNVKDVYGYFDIPRGPGQEMSAKQSQPMQMIEDYASGKDYRGLPLFKPADAPHVEGEPDNFAEAFGEDLAHRFLPVGWQNQRAKEGSNISPLERSFAIRPAPGYQTNRGRTLEQMKKHDTFDWKRKGKADRKAAAELAQ